MYASWRIRNLVKGNTTEVAVVVYDTNGDYYFIMNLLAFFIITKLYRRHLFSKSLTLQILQIWRVLVPRTVL